MSRESDAPKFGDLERAVLGPQDEDEDAQEYDWVQKQLSEAVQKSIEAGGEAGDDDDEGMNAGLEALQDCMNHTAVLECCGAGETESLLELLTDIKDSDRPIDLNAPGPDGDTALHLACLYGHIECVKLLMENGADADVVNPEDGSTALHDAAAGGYLDILMMIHEKAPELINVPDSDGDTPLHNAARGNHEHVVLWLLHQGAAMDVKNGEGNIAVEEAEDPSIVELMVAAAAQKESSVPESTDAA